ncbi:MAG: glycosyltransferase family protein [Deltaproteobacteria bacterium]|nr:glycosyltransferase family protein [Deltaproteobacteria bacterium]
MGSTRLPGKILKPILQKTLLEYEIERLKRVKSATQIIIATTTDKKDDAVEALCKKIDIEVFRGSESDVLSRYFEAAKKFKASVVVRITADCPLIEPEIVDQAIRIFLESPSSASYVSNTIHRTFPRGLDVEVFSFEALKNAHEKATDQADREHVTPFIKRHTDLPHLKNILHSEDFSHYRWTVDTPEDFELIKRVLEALYPQDPHFTLKDVLRLLEIHPDWPQINAHIEQKK